MNAIEIWKRSGGITRPIYQENHMPASREEWENEINLRIGGTLVIGKNTIELKRIDGEVAVLKVTYDKEANQ